MDAPQICPVCGKSAIAEGPQGLCPECLMKSGFDTAPGSDKSCFVPPSVADIAKVFPQFEIISLLGHGGMGAVYKARQPALGRFVALKILPPKSAEDPGFGERFNREARALARLNHPNIVAVYDFGQAGAMPYFLMEYVEGPTLRQVVQSGQLAACDTLRIVMQVCEALQFAHEEGVVHRDIKPENILLDAKGRVKIADFGIAKVLDLEPQDIALTGAKEVVGTAHYMAPEQFEHPQSVDHRADIFSLGVVFYELLTGELPLGKFAPPSQKGQADARLDEVVLHTLEKEPARRYQQARQVRNDLATIATTQSGLRILQSPSCVPPKMPMTQPTKHFPQHPRSPKPVLPPLVWSALGFVLVVLIGLGVYYARNGHPKPGAASANPPGATNPAVTVGMSEKTPLETQRWDFIPKGLCVIDGTTFLIDGAIRTGGLASVGNGGRRPGAILNTAVNQRGTRIHLLQASEYAWKVPPGAPYAHFVLHYADGKTHHFDLNWGIHGFDWFRGPNEKEKTPRDENTRIGWEKQRADGMYIRMYHTILENPYPDVLMTSFDVISPLSQANVLLFGFTIDNDTRPLADPLDPSEFRIDQPPPQSITFILQDSAGKPVPEAKLSWIAVARRGRIDFPLFQADALGEVKVEVPPGSLVQIIYTASGPEGKQAAGVLRLEEGGLFPEKQIVELTTAGLR